MMKKVLIMMCCSIVAVCLPDSQAYGIGISPARTSKIYGENEPIDFGVTYTLIRPSRRYSCFDPLTPMGLNSEITGCSSSTGVEYQDDGTILIDWDAISGTTITASARIWSPDSWQPTTEPGDSYLGSLVQHIEMRETGSGISAICAVVSQIWYFRNYALRGEILGLESEYSAGEAVDFIANITDYHSNTSLLYRYDFSYSIDWESDGIIDETMSGIRMTDDAGQTDSNAVTSGYKYKELGLGHVYTEPGEYLITLNLTDQVETTTMQIPVHITPEPTILSIMALSSFVMLRGKKRSRNKY